MTVERLAVKPEPSAILDEDAHVCRSLAPARRLVSGHVDTVRILRSLSELSEIAGPLFLAIGVFDGVHLGHRAVIDALLPTPKSGSGTAVVLTFDPHPLRVLRPEQAPRLLTSTRHKLRLIEAVGRQIPRLLSL